MKIFEKITWPEGAIYNIQTSDGTKLEGSADVEQIKSTQQKNDLLTEGTVITLSNVDLQESM